MITRHGEEDVLRSSSVDIEVDMTGNFTLNNNITIFLFLFIFIAFVRITCMHVYVSNLDAGKAAIFLPSLNTDTL